MVVNFFKKVISKAVSTRIEIHRSVDHSWRRITGKPRAKRSMITPEMYLGGEYKESGLQTLKEWGITGVISMRLTNNQKFKQVDWLSFLNLPTPDQTPPTLESLAKGVAFVKSIVNEKGKVYIHCRHGEGRGPSMAAAYLISQGLTTDDAILQIRRVRTFIKPTPEQIEQLRKFEEKLKSETKVAEIVKEAKKEETK